MRRTVVILGLISLLGLFPSKLLAWNNAGHKLVALLAYRSLPAGKKAKLVEALVAHPHYRAHLLDGAPDDPEKRNEWIVMQAATWPDWVRPSDRHDPRISTMYHIGDRHFIDIPLVLPEYQAKFNAITIAPKEHDAVKDLHLLVGELKKGGNGDETTAIDLCWILHVVGDIHQPLHATTMFSDQFPAPDGDHGGNYFIIRLGASSVKLHAMWDDMLGTEEKYARIDNLARRLARDYKRKDFEESLKRADFMDWARESHALAEAKAYRDTNGKLLKGTFSKERFVSHVPAEPLPDGYRQAAVEVAKRQIALAAFRLADVLDGLP